jgi:hypothetical protein
VLPAASSLTAETFSAHAHFICNIYGGLPPLNRFPHLLCDPKYPNAPIDQNEPSDFDPKKCQCHRPPPAVGRRLHSCQRPPPPTSQTILCRPPSITGRIRPSSPASAPARLAAPTSDPTTSPPPDALVERPQICPQSDVLLTRREAPGWRLLSVRACVMLACLLLHAAAIDCVTRCLSFLTMPSTS